MNRTVSNRIIFNTDMMFSFLLFTVYKSDVIDYMKRPGGFIDWWDNRHLSSNIVMSHNNNEPLSNRYTMLHGKHSNVLVFGFIYNLSDSSDKVVVESVIDTVHQRWFQNALTKEKYDAVLVMAHMGTDDPSVTVLRDAIRQHTGDRMPIQFITGHTHLRRYAIVDELSTSVEAGRYLDTVGFVSFPNKATVQAAGSNASNNLFQHVFLDANVQTLKETLVVDELTTPSGREVSGFVQRTRQSLGLDKKIGCAPRDFFIDRTLYDEDSLWRVYREQVVPTQLKRDTDGNTNPVIIISQASWRYDIFGGENLYDDIVAVSPFNEPVYKVGELDCSEVLRLNQTLNANATTTFYKPLPAFILAGTMDPRFSACELYTHHFELESILNALAQKKNVMGTTFKPIKSHLTSTSIWTSFVLEQWPCPGDKSVSIPWLDDDHGINSTGDGGQQPSKLHGIIILAFCLIFLCGSLFTCWVVLKHLCFRSHIYEDEMGAINEEGCNEGEFA
jgi:hypothetical protein